MNSVTCAIGIAKYAEREGEMGEAYIEGDSEIEKIKTV